MGFECFAEGIGRSKIQFCGNIGDGLALQQHVRGVVHSLGVVVLHRRYVVGGMEASRDILSAIAKRFA